MSQENVDLIRSGYDAANRHDFDFLRSIQAPGFRYESLITGRTYAGPDALREVMGEVEEAVRDYRQDIVRVVDMGDHVAVSIRLTGIGRASGTPATQSAAVVWTIRDGKVARGTGHPTLDEAVRAVQSPQ